MPVIGGFRRSKIYIPVGKSESANKVCMAPPEFPTQRCMMQEAVGKPETFLLISGAASENPKRCRILNGPVGNSEIPVHIAST